MSVPLSPDERAERLRRRILYVRVGWAIVNVAMDTVLKFLADGIVPDARRPSGDVKQKH